MLKCSKIYGDTLTFLQKSQLSTFCYTARSLCTLAYINFYAATDPNIKQSKYFMSLPLAWIFALTRARSRCANVCSLFRTKFCIFWTYFVRHTYLHKQLVLFRLVCAVQTLCEDHEVIVFFWSISPNLDGNIGIVRKQHQREGT